MTEIYKYVISEHVETKRTSSILKTTFYQIGKCK